jgi:hypothetical protein
MVSGRSLRADGGSWTRGLRAAVEPAVSWLSVPSGTRIAASACQLAAFPRDLFDYQADERPLQLPGAAPLLRG